MATILLTWELGGGIGHLVRLAPIARGLVGRGHRVFAALRDLSRAKTIFGDCEVFLLQAPSKVVPATDRKLSPVIFAQMLYNIGFGDERARLLPQAIRVLLNGRGVV